MSDVPRARKLLAELKAEAPQLSAKQIARRIDQVIIPLLHRRPHVAPDAPKKAPPVTPEVAARMRAYKRRNPDASQMEIAMKVGGGCCAGRVSEALHGDR